MKRIITIFIFLALFIFSQKTHAQSYSSAAGLHLGWFFTGTYKKAVNDGLYLDLFAGFPSYGGNYLIVGGNIEFHKELEGIDELYYYYGGGANAIAGSGFFTFGITGILGLDYKFEEIPLNMSLDWMPGFYFGKYFGGFDVRGGGISVRYILSQN